MKQLIDYIPLIIFFILFKTSGIFIATGALIAATAVQIV
ncbi:septation protein IspZ, partial [Photobacterium lucens]